MSRRLQSGRGRLGALGLLALLVLGCGQSDEPSNANDTNLQYPTAELDLFDRDADRFLAGALSILTQRCMAEAGFEYVPTDPRELEAVDTGDRPTTYPFQGFSIESRRADGYFAWMAADDLPEPAVSTETRQQEIFDALTPSEQERFQVTLAGQPDDEGMIPLFGGCYGVSARQVFDDTDSWNEVNQIVRNIEADVNNRMRTNRELLDLELEWAACMHEAGFNVNTVSDAEFAGTQVYQGQSNLSPGEMEPLREREIAIAVADARCSEDVGLGRAAARVHDDVVEDVLAERDADIISFREQLAAAVERARELVGSS